jgi:hypothetical protein
MAERLQINSRHHAKVCELQQVILAIEFIVTEAEIASLHSLDPIRPLAPENSVTHSHKLICDDNSSMFLDEHKISFEQSVSAPHNNSLKRMARTWEST